MKKLKIRIIGISYSTGKPKRKTIKVNCKEDFKTTSKPNIFLELYPQLADILPAEVINLDFKQYDEWFSGEDKTDFMYREGFSQINTWKILSIDGRKEEIKYTYKESSLVTRVKGENKIKKISKKDNEVLRMIEFNISNPKLLTDMLACYVEIYDTIKDLGFRRQFNIILSTTTVAYKSATNSLKQLGEYSESLKGKSLKELKQLQK